MLLSTEPEDSGPVGAGRVLGLIRDGSATTRTELAQQTRLSRSTLAERVQALLALELVREVGGQASTGGRPPATLAFNRGAGVVLVADLDLDRSRVAVTDLAGEPLVESVLELGVGEPPEHLLGAVQTAFEAVLAAAGASAGRVWGVGVGLPSPVAFSRGEPVGPPRMRGWDRFSVPNWFGVHYDVPVLVDNQVNVMALGEHRVHWRDFDPLLFVRLGHTVDCGIVSGARVHRGAQGTAGNIGHIRVAGHDEVLCRCGNTGCLEALAGTGALVARLSAAGLPARTAGDIAAHVRAGEPAALRLMRTAGRQLGEVVAQCINFFNPGAVVVGGAAAATHEHLLAGLQEVALNRSLPMATADLVTGTSRLGERAGTIGAATMVIDHVLDPGRIDRAVHGYSR